MQQTGVRFGGCKAGVEEECLGFFLGGEQPGLFGGDASDREVGLAAGDLDGEVLLAVERDDFVVTGFLEVGLDDWPVDVSGDLVDNSLEGEHNII